MNKLLFLGLPALLLTMYADAAAMPRAFIPPAQKNVSWQSPLPKAALRDMLDAGCPRFTVDAFAGKTTALIEDDGPASRRVALEWPCELFSETFLGPAFDLVEGYAYLMQVQSREATALRLRVDLTTLAPGQAVYAACGGNLLAYGPYTAASGLCWLDPVPGDTCTLIATSPDDALPRFAVRAVAHFYRDLEKTLYECPINAACVEDDAYQEVATAVGQLLIPIVDLGQYICTGTLIANAANGENQPYFLSAHHCFDGDVDVPGVIVFWDYRAADCDGSGVPDLWDASQVPRSAGKALLAHDACLDGEFIELESVPIGALGRAWAGWDTRDLDAGDAVALAHYPQGTAMKAAFGTIQDTDVQGCLDYACLSAVYHQNLIQWDQGITQGGSSGSPLLLIASDYAVTGMLSNGPVHDCDTPEQNVDNFSSFARFYPQIACYLVADASCEDATTCRRCCLFGNLFGAEGAMASGLRSFRDNVLKKTATGERLVESYYQIDPAWTGKVMQSDQAKGALSLLAIPAAWLGAVLEGQ